MKPLTLDWLHSILIDLAVPVGTSLTVALAAAAVNQLLLCPRRAQEAEDGARHKFLEQEGQVPDLQRRLEQADARARMETQQRRIADNVIQRGRLWK